jgi:hypothetical protein
MPRQREKDTQEKQIIGLQPFLLTIRVLASRYLLTFKISTNMVEKTKKNGIEVKIRMM